MLFLQLYLFTSVGRWMPSGCNAQLPGLLWLGGVGKEPSTDLTFPDADTRLLETGRLAKEEESDFCVRYDLDWLEQTPLSFGCLLGNMESLLKSDAELLFKFASHLFISLQDFVSISNLLSTWAEHETRGLPFESMFISTKLLAISPFLKWFGNDLFSTQLSLEEQFTHVLKSPSNLLQST